MWLFSQKSAILPSNRSFNFPPPGGLPVASEAFPDLLCTFRTCGRRKLVCQSRLLVSASQGLRLERGAPHNVEGNGRGRIRPYHHRISCQHAIKRRPESAVSLISVAVRLALYAPRTNGDQSPRIFPELTRHVRASLRHEPSRAVFDDLQKSLINLSFSWWAL
jgi:hypothetical protein